MAESESRIALGASIISEEQSHKRQTPKSPAYRKQFVTIALSHFRFAALVFARLERGASTMFLKFEAAFVDRYDEGRSGAR